MQTGLWCKTQLVIYLSYHRLRGSASPVLTATHHSYGSPRLSDFFSGSPLGVRPLNGHSRKMAQTTCFTHKDVPFAVKVATFHTP